MSWSEEVASDLTANRRVFVGWKPKWRRLVELDYAVKVDVHMYIYIYVCRWKALEVFKWEADRRLIVDAGSPKEPGQKFGVLDVLGSFSQDI